MRPVYSQDSFTGTGNGATLDMSADPCKTFSLQVKSTGTTATHWNVVIEGSNDGANFFTLATHTDAGAANADADIVFAVDKPVCFVRSRLASVTLSPATAIVATLTGA